MSKANIAPAHGRIAKGLELFNVGEDMILDKTYSA
jgi:hypothetical protein